MRTKIERLLFIVKARDFFSLHYIGMTTKSLSSRIVGTGSRTGHLRDYVSGRYYIYNADKLKRLRKVPEYHLEDNYEKFFSNLEEYQTLARMQLEALHFLLCPFDENRPELYQYRNSTGGGTYDLIEIAESLLINQVFRLTEEERSKLFPIIDNSKRISAKIENCNIKLINRFPDNITINGLMEIKQ